MRYAILTGPSHAQEVGRRAPTAVMTVSRDPQAAITIQQVFVDDCLRIYTSYSVVGAEQGGASKNMLALAADTPRRPVGRASRSVFRAQRHRRPHRHVHQQA